MVPHCYTYFQHFHLVYFCKNVKIWVQNKKSFVEIKPVPVVKHVEISQFIFAKVV